MRRREAEAQCPDAVCVDADDALEARTFEIVARAVEVLTPRVVLDRPGLCAFMTRGPSRYFGGDDALAVRVREGVAAALGGTEPDIRVGIADGGFAARLAARRAVADAPFVVDPGGSAAFCAPWPVSVLDDPELVSLLVPARAPHLGRRRRAPGRRGAGPLRCRRSPLPRPRARARRRAARARHAAPRSRGADGARSARRARRRGRVRGEGPGRAVAVPARRARARVHAGGDRGRDRARRTARALLAARPRAHTRRARRACALAARRLARGDSRSNEPTTRSRLDHRRFRRCSASCPTRSCPPTAGSSGSGVATRPPTTAPTARSRACRACSGTKRSRPRWCRAAARPPSRCGGCRGATHANRSGRWWSTRSPRRGRARCRRRSPRACSTRRWRRSCATRTGARSWCRGGASSRRRRRGWSARCCRAVVAPVRGWAGPWASDVRWWDPPARRRCARWQVVVDCGAGAGEVACVVRVEAGRAGIEAIYD